MPSRPLEANTVAEHILWLRRNEETTPMHILKLVYIAHGWMLGLNNQLLVREDAKVWPYGPVIEEIYMRYRHFRAEPIDMAASSLADYMDATQTDLIERVVESYDKYDAFQLSALTHQDGTPWEQTHRELGLGATIPTHLIRDYYAELAKKAAARAETTA